MTTQIIATPFTRVWRGLGETVRRARVRRELQQLLNLDDRMLQDLGISRAQAEFQATRARRWW